MATAERETRAAELLTRAWLLGLEMSLRAAVDEWSVHADADFVWLNFLHGGAMRKCGVKFKLDAATSVDCGRAHIVSGRWG